MEKKLFLFLQSLLLNNSLGIKHFDWFNNQPFDPESTATYKTPAVFLQILPYKVKTYRGNRQIADLNFVLHIEKPAPKPMNNIRGEQAQLSALDHLDLLQNIFVALQGAGDINNGIGYLLRTGVNPDHDFRQNIVHSETFSSRIIDDSAVRETTVIPNDMPLEIAPIEIITTT